MHKMQLGTSGGAARCSMTGGEVMVAAYFFPQARATPR